MCAYPAVAFTWHFTVQNSTQKFFPVKFNGLVIPAKDGVWGGCRVASQFRAPVKRATDPMHGQLVHFQAKTSCVEPCLNVHTYYFGNEICRLMTGGQARDLWISNPLT